jgi:hypothetical protein
MGKTMSGLFNISARTLAVTSPAVPILLGSSAHETVRLSGHESVDSLIALDAFASDSNIEIKTRTDSLNITGLKDVDLVSADDIGSITAKKKVLVNCPCPLASTVVRDGMFTLNIGLFMDGTDNNKTINPVPSVSANSYTARNVSICRNASAVKFLRTLIRRLAVSATALCTVTLMTACAAGSNDLV